MEKYLNKCLKSLLINECLEKLEILVINDGSKDNSLKIAQKYESQYPDIIRVIDKENGNYGSCINRGLKEATGKYIKILDADDSYDTDIFQKYINEISFQDVDLIINDFKIVNTKNEEFSQPFNYTFPHKCVFNFLDNEPLMNIKKLCMHAVAYKRENILKINYKQTEGISYTDMEWVFLPITTVKKSYYFNEPLYKYLTGREGQTMDYKIYIKNSIQLLTVIKSMINLYASFKGADIYKKILEERILGDIEPLYRIYIIDKFKDIKDLIVLDEDLKSICPNIYLKTNEFKFNYCFNYVKNWRKGNKKKESIKLKLHRRINRLKKYLFS